MLGLVNAAQNSLRSFLEEDPRELHDKEFSKQEERQDTENRALELLKARLKETEDDLPPDEFLRKCLVFQQLNLEVAERTARGFLRFRGNHGWPWRIPAADVATPMQTELHWMLHARAGGCERLPPDSPSTSYSRGPAACLVFNMAKLDASVCSLQDYQMLTMFLMEQATDSRQVQERGIAAIVDFRQVQLTKLLGAVSVEDVYRGVGFWKGAFPCRLRRAWLVQPPLALQWPLRAILQLLSPKLRERVRIVSSDDEIEDLAEDLDEFELPPTLGGSKAMDWQAEAARYLAEATDGRRVGVTSLRRTSSKSDGGAQAAPLDEDAWSSGGWCCGPRKRQ